MSLQPDPSPVRSSASSLTLSDTTLCDTTDHSGTSTMPATAPFDPAEQAAAQLPSGVAVHRRSHVGSVPGLRAPRTLTGRARQERTHEVFTEAGTCADDAERQALLDEVIVMHLELAHAEARRYRSRGVSLDDLQQVAALALTKATSGYDVTTGHDFLSYAVPTIRGELRKHFRDHGWMVRPPRRIQELQARINRADGELSAALGRAPTPAELATHLDEPAHSVMEALASDGCFVPASLDHPTGGEDGTTTLGDLLPLDDAEHRAAEARLLLDPVLGHLSERDRDIVAMRFGEGLTQREIAARIGVTQMQVSRLLGRILAQLRQDVGDVDHD